MTDNRPLIGIAPDLAVAGHQGGLHHFAYVRYAQPVIKAGGLPVLLVQDAALVALYLERCQGIVLTGGGQPDPALYRGETFDRDDPVHPDREAFDLALAKGALQRGVPVLGLCLGMQMMALAAGGTMENVVGQPELHKGGVKHEISLSGALAQAVGEGQVTVNSYHSQGILELPGCFEPLAQCTQDGLVEAFYAPDHPFAWGVQWHAEFEDTPKLDGWLFGELVKKARH